MLQFIHSFGYIHADIKATNILKSSSKKSNKKSSEWYLVDYGLVDRYLQPDGRHREEKADKKKANNGTVEYRSRDAHIGLVSRRADFECLGYNLIQWLDGSLPWMSCLTDASKVEAKKRQFMANVEQCLSQCFADKTVPKCLKEFFDEINRIGFKSEPNYRLLKQILTEKRVKSSSNDVNSDTDVIDVSPVPKTRKRKANTKQKISNKRKKPNQMGVSGDQVVAETETPAMSAIRKAMAKKSNNKRTKTSK